MKKLLCLFLLFVSLSETVSALPVNTSKWPCNQEHITAEATEFELKSDLKNDFRVYHATIINKTKSFIEVEFPTNKDVEPTVQKALNSGLDLKDLMEIPKEIAVESYREDVGTGTIATAHKGLICILATAGTIISGVGMLGIYPQQKTEEFFAHKKLKKEYKKIKKALVDTLTLSPLEEADVILFVPVDNTACIIKTTEKTPVEDTQENTNCHQL